MYRRGEAGVIGVGGSQRSLVHLALISEESRKEGYGKIFAFEKGK